MNYGDLLVEHERFYGDENRACYYDEYMKHKDWSSWGSSVPVIEVIKLFGFVLSWDPHFEGDVAIFCRAYRQVYPLLVRLQGMTIDSVDLHNGDLRADLKEIFDNMAHCTRERRYESTGASKMLHTIVPELFVMWDRKIRKGILGNENRKYGTDYIDDFLPQMQQEAIEVKNSCAEKLKLEQDQAIEYVSKHAGGKTLAKLIDEYNYMKYTLIRMRQ